MSKHIAPFFKDKNLSAIEPTDVVEFHRSLADKKQKRDEKAYSRKTRRNAHAVMVCMFNVAVDLRLIKVSPVPRRSGPKQEKVAKVALSEQQVADLLRRVPVQYKAFYAVLVLTGIRSGEALGLKWMDIDLADSMLHVRRAIYRGQETTPKTPGSLRDRPMMPELQQALLNHKVMAVYRQPSDYVFASSSGRPLNPDLLRSAMQATLKNMGARFERPRADGLHLLRHTSGSLFYRRSGGDLKTTQEWLGHSNSRITADVYVHSESGQQRRAAEVLDDGSVPTAAGAHQGACELRSECAARCCALNCALVTWNAA